MDQFLVMHKKRGHRVELPRDQRLPNKDLARLGYIHRPVMHALLRIDNQTIQGAALPRCHLRCFLLPMRIEVVPLDKMDTHLFQPFRFYTRHRTGIQFGCFGEFSSHHPFRALLRQD